MSTKVRTAADIMHRDIIAVHQDDTLQEAMQLMTENHVTGLPVTNMRSQCVGIITASDILNFEQDHAESTEEANAEMAQHFDMDRQQWESVRVSSFALEEFGDTLVKEIMSSDLIAVTRDTPLKEVAQTMRKERIHRILVLGEDSALFGIISSSDFVTLYADEA